MNSGQLYNNLTATGSSPVGLTAFTYQWSSSAGGVFSAPTSSVTNFTAPVVGGQTTIKITCIITDACGRKGIFSSNVLLYPPPTAPVAINDTISFTNLCSASTTTINVLTNDYDVNDNMVNSITFIGGCSLSLDLADKPLAKIWP